MKINSIKSKILICFLGGLAGTATVYASDSEHLTLNRCIARGLEANLELQVKKLMFQESEEGVREAWGAFLPTLRVDYNHKKLTNNAEVETDNDYLSQRSNSWSVSLSQPVFSGFSSVAGLDEARDVREYSGQQIEQLKLKLMRDIRSSFYQMLQGQSLIDKWQESLVRLKRQKEIASVWVREQLATKLRQLEVNVEIANAEQNLAGANSLFNIAEARLRELLALDPEAELKIVGDLTVPSVEFAYSLEEYLATASAQRPELRLAALETSIAQNQLKEIRGRNLPHASIDAAWVDYTRDYEESSLDADDRDYYILSLNLSMQPFQGGRNLFAYRRQKLKIQRLNVERQRQKAVIATEVRTAFEQVNDAVAQVNSAQKGLEEAQEAFSFTEQAMALEVCSLDVLLDAGLRLTRSEVDHINALNALRQAEVALQYSIGAGM